MGTCSTKNEHFERIRRKKRLANAIKTKNTDKPKTSDEAMIKKQVNQIFDRYDLDKDDMLNKEEVRFMILSMAS